MSSSAEGIGEPATLLDRRRDAFHGSAQPAIAHGVIGNADRGDDGHTVAEQGAQAAGEPGDFVFAHHCAEHRQTQHATAHLRREATHHYDEGAPEYDEPEEQLCKLLFVGE